jgi:energy-coupling factor transporter ATP-binding protein EcfA2
VPDTTRHQSMTARGTELDEVIPSRMPTSTIFIVTHNIEEAVLLADRVIVLGRNPGHIRADFQLDLPYPRDRKAARFTEYVDYIYKVMTRPEVEVLPVPQRKPLGKRKYQMLPHALPGGIGGVLELLAHRGGQRVRQLPSWLPDTPAFSPFCAQVLRSKQANIMSKPLVAAYRARSSLTGPR